MKEKEMSFWDHLEEFRWTLIRIIIAVFVLAIAGFILVPKIFDSIILAPSSSDFVTYRFLENASQFIPFLPDFSADAFNVEMLNINMTTQFMTYISTSLALAVLLAIPISSMSYGASSALLSTRTRLKGSRWLSDLAESCL